uniref:Neur_chan_LBD domain-containing protein n=1 Tax=Ascaris lumbricoides TaxID=6252 RepID=A0A0M3IJS9_ASCLU
MEMRWFDVRLANNYSKSIRIREMSVIEKIWTPDPYFVNSKYSYFHVVSFPNFRMRISPNGLVVYTLRVTLQPACQMIFCRFPHDRQQCDLRISSIAYPQSNVRFSWHSTEPVRFVSSVTLPELRIASMLTHQCHVEGKLIHSSCLRLVFNLQRDGSRFIVEKYIPSTLAMMFAWVAPYVPYNYEEVRIITPITVLLTLVQMEKGDQQVRTSYITSMDTWFGAMKMFSVISLLESLAVLALIKRSRAMGKQTSNATNQLEEENFRAEEKRLTRLYHRLDSIARFLSPLFFIIFFVYYVIFVAQSDEMECIKG